MGTLMVAGFMSAFVPPASAQVGYAAGLCVPGNRVVDYGTRAIGETFDIRMITQCPWDPGNLADIVVNDTPVGTKVVDAGSGVTVNVTVASGTALAINDPVRVNGGCGENKAVGSSTSAAAGGAVETYTALFRVACPGAVRASAVGNGIAFTGANILKWGGIGVVLVAGGWLLVGLSRRRRANPTA